MELKEGDIVLISDLEKIGWVNCHELYCGCQIWKKGEKRILYDLRKNMVYRCYVV
jgi:hypothetical protein